MCSCKGPLGCTSSPSQAGRQAGRSGRPGNLNACTIQQKKSCWRHLHASPWPHVFQVLSNTYRAILLVQATKSAKQQQELHSPNLWGGSAERTCSMLLDHWQVCEALNCNVCFLYSGSPSFNTAIEHCVTCVISCDGRPPSTWLLLQGWSVNTCCGVTQASSTE